MARLIDADELIAECKRMIQDNWNNGTAPVSWAEAYATFIDDIEVQDTIPAPQWISVEERLPERNGEYIVTACDEGEPYDEIIWNDTVVVCAEYYKGCWTWKENSTEYSLDGIVTHWMPLPTNPKDGGE